VLNSTDAQYAEMCISRSREARMTNEKSVEKRIKKLEDTIIVMWVMWWVLLMFLAGVSWWWMQ